MTEQVQLPLNKIQYSEYKGEEELLEIIALVERDLSEPYSIFVYRFFLYRHPELCIIARDGSRIVGVIIGRAFMNKNERFRGYIGMLAVAQEYRRKYGIGTQLVKRELAVMQNLGTEEVVLEAECSNKIALEFYRKLGFRRDKYLARYYMNGSDAYRLKYYFSSTTKQEDS